MAAKLLANVHLGTDNLPIYGIQLMFLISGLFRAFTLKLLGTVRTRRYVPLRTLIASALFLSREGGLTRSNGSNVYDVLKTVKKKLEEKEDKEKQWRVKRWW
jgi:hypothetical protein